MYRLNGVCIIVPEMHCFACGSMNAKQTCSRCHTATYCNAKCASKGWRENGHNVTCRHYAALANTPAPDPVETVDFDHFGWPAHLENDEEISGYELFAKECADAVPNLRTAAKEPATKNADDLVALSWMALTADQQLDWTKKAQQRQIGTAVFAFTTERLPFVIKDIEDKRSVYPNDSLMKQIWRNLYKKARTYYEMRAARAGAEVKTTARKGKRGAAESLDAADDKRAKRQKTTASSQTRTVAPEIVQEVTGAFTRGDIPIEMAMAIVNNLPRESVLMTAGTNRFLHDTAWRILYKRDLESLVSQTPAGQREIASVFAMFKREHPEASDVDYAWIYEKLVASFATKMADALIGNLNDDNATNGTLPERRFFAVTGGINGSQWFNGAVVQRYDTLAASMGARAEEDYYASRYDIRNWVLLDKKSIEGLPKRAIGKEFTEVELRPFKKQQIVKNMRRELSLLFQMWCVGLLKGLHDRDEFMKFYGEPYFRNGIVFSDLAYHGALASIVLPPLLSVLERNRFGYGTDTGKVATISTVRDAFVDFFKEYLMRGFADIQLYLLTEPIPGDTSAFSTEEPDEFYDGDNDKNDGNPKLQGMVQRRISLVTGGDILRAPSRTMGNAFWESVRKSCISLHV